jgi:hypothetical protein
MELVAHFQGHLNQSTDGRSHLKERAEEVFSRDKKAERGISVKELHAKIGQLAT